MLGITADLNIAIVYTWIIDIVMIPTMDLNGWCCHHQNILTPDLEVAWESLPMGLLSSVVPLAHEPWLAGLKTDFKAWHHPPASAWL